MASYQHCEACKRAYDRAATPSCPACGQSLATTSAAERIAAATELLAAALAQVSASERAALVDGLARALGVAPAPVERAPVPVQRALPPPSRTARWRPLVGDLVARLTRPMRAFARALG
jgi:hypothetical protein